MNNGISADDRLGDIEYTYTYFGETASKKYYGWDPKNNGLIEYLETSIYDNYKRLNEKKVEMTKVDGTKILISHQIIRVLTIMEML
jgi:hypothetical protein